MPCGVERLDLVGDDRGLSLLDRLEQVAVGQHRDALLPRAVARVEVLLDVEALGQLGAGRVDQELARHLRLLEAHLRHEVLHLEDLAADDLVGPLVGDLEVAQRVGQLVGVRPRDEERGRPLEHRHVRAVVGDVRDERGGRGAGADHHDLLVGEVDLVGPLLRVDHLALEVVEAGPLGRVAGVVPVVALAHPEEAGT